LNKSGLLGDFLHCACFRLFAGWLHETHEFGNVGTVAIEARRQLQCFAVVASLLLLLPHVTVRGHGLGWARTNSVTSFFTFFKSALEL
jgi:hypothetical protein